MKYTTPRLHSFNSTVRHGDCTNGTGASHDGMACQTGSSAGGSCGTGNAPKEDSCITGNSATRVWICTTGNGVKTSHSG